MPGQFINDSGRHLREYSAGEDSFLLELAQMEGKHVLTDARYRPTRFADKPTQWIYKQAQARGDIDVELVDLRDHALPFFDEMASNMWV
ncbi:MAG TPA: hypothetical protein VNO35_16895, partial [Steroidobacteraceae bacterium]|nr:hypothetical protein [Steroidobacteraceae bacterium]